MKAVVLAYHNIGCAGLSALLKHGYDIAAVFTHSDDPNEAIWFNSVAELAASHGTPVFAPENINHPMWVNRIRRLEPDILFSFYYRNLVKPDILDIPRHGCLNLHGSLLPRYRGRAPLNWVLVRGESETGVTLHYMTPRPDDGDIVGQERFSIAAADTALDLFGKAIPATETLLDDVLPKLMKGTAPRTPQNHDEATYYGGRTPADGEIDWSQLAHVVRNLIRAVTRPYPGAFSHLGARKILIWSATVLENPDVTAALGTITSIDPLVVQCGEGALKIDFAQAEGGVYVSGGQLVDDLNIQTQMQFGKHSSARPVRKKTTVLILGVNGFIGSALGERLLETGGYEVHGMDLKADNISHLVDRQNFIFEEGDISIHREWIEYHVRKCDVVLPLVAITTPIEYIRNPVRVFELDFEENLRVVRYCVKYYKRLIFPSTSEVYGMCTEEEFNEDTSNLVTGPINKLRWIYSSSKQLLDRLIWAYGAQHGLRFTLFRPFNWIGPRFDSLDAARIGSSRAITQLILNLVEGTPIQLVDGGLQKRCFTDVREGVECLYRIIENHGGTCDGKIINIGNPDGEASIKELAELLVAKFEKHPLRDQFPPFAGITEIESVRYYGDGFQDVQHRRPSVRNAKRCLGWVPTIPLEESVESTLDYFLRHAVSTEEA